MSDTTEFNIGDEVMDVAGVKGSIVDIQQMSNDETAYGVVDAYGGIRFYTKSALKRFL